MTELLSTDVNDTSIDFVLERSIPGFPGADIHIRVLFLDDSVQLDGFFCEPIFDGYCYRLDTVAVPSPAQTLLRTGN
jgi:hypothetical protein